MRQGVINGAMAFGKYRGLVLADVPIGYLGWLLDSDFLGNYAGLEEIIKDELRARLGIARPVAAPHLPIKVPTSVDLAVAQRIVMAGRREFARTHHPDIGGNTEIMQDGNAAADWLLQLLQAVHR